MKYIIGTRGSKLALTQAQYVADILHNAYPMHEFSLRIIKTKGDQNQVTPLHQMQDKGIFVKEIEAQLLEGEIHLAVHSMKDMPSELPDELCFAKPLCAEDPRDVLIFNKQQDILQTGEKCILGTGSKRRAFQLQRLYPQVEIAGIRGNVDTRIKKMKEQEMDGIVLAAAGMKRLQRTAEISVYLDPKVCIPACTQGILAIEMRKDDACLLHMFEHIYDEDTYLRMQAERAFLKQIEGGCHVPVGAYLDVQDQDITLYGVLGSEDGRILIQEQMHGTRKDAQQLGIQLAKHLLEKVGKPS